MLVKYYSVKFIVAAGGIYGRLGAQSPPVEDMVEIYYEKRNL